jgi:surface antigen
MLVWYNFRPAIESYNLIPIMESTLNNFKRLTDINKNYKLWSDNNLIAYNDVAEGFTLGNCYFIAALSALANKKNLIEKIFNF